MPQRKTRTKVAEKQPAPAKKTFAVNFTKGELTHLRDLFNVGLPPVMQTVSQMLAAQESRPHLESKLWQKLSRACAQAGVPLNEDAPDFVATASAPPPIAVYRIEPEEQAEEGGDEGTPGDFSAVFEPEAEVEDA